ncbi:MAG: hypothetical protein HY437_00185 [Candidatus Magasanikbacteria bacterium]|nr:hypothetical protein [Candidatus Magasanikbacteria bacterium]
MRGRARIVGVLISFVILFGISGTAFAATEKSCRDDSAQAKCNQVCWLYADCRREGGSWEQTSEAARVCGSAAEGWGYCFVPARSEVVAVPFFGMQDVSNAWRYARVIYLLVLSIGGLVGLLALLHAGFLWIIAHGHRGDITRAKEYMLRASLGLLVLFGSYTLLSLLSPDVMQLQEARKVFLRTTESSLER